MGLLGRLFGVHRDRLAPTEKGRVDGEEAAQREEELSRFGDIRVDVVGESHYQPVIRKACGWKPGVDTHFECMAELVPEPTNKFDPNAIMVRIEGECVGYLSRRDAARLGPMIKAAIQRQGPGMCRAVIAGRAHGETDNLGVFLHIDAELV